MVEFGGGFAVGASGLQWLVWIQLLVTILLIVFLYCFSLYALETGDGDVRVSSAEEGGVGRLLFGAAAGKVSDLSVDGETRFVRRSMKVGGSSSIRGEISTAGVSRRIVRSLDGTEGDDATSVKDITSSHAITETHHHPCAILKFAREAFLKCLGLDCIAEDSTSKKQDPS